MVACAFIRVATGMHEYAIYTHCKLNLAQWMFLMYSAFMYSLNTTATQREHTRLEKAAHV